jgi:plasmid stability protein
VAAVVIRGLADDIHAGLRELAAERHQSVESLAREALADLVRSKRAGIDFEQLSIARITLGLAEDGPDWDATLDDPGLSRSVLGL